MRLQEGTIRLSASDLMRFKGCRHATTLDLRHMELRDIRPAADGDEAVLLQRQGDEHELAHLDGLRRAGRAVVEIPKDGIPLERSVALTLEALRAGPDVVFQGALLGGAWGGYSDFLERVDRPSALGPFSYEVVDTKLKRSPDPKHVLHAQISTTTGIYLAVVDHLGSEALEEVARTFHAIRNDWRGAGARELADAQGGTE